MTGRLELERSVAGPIVCGGFRQGRSLGRQSCPAAV